ncbi:peroxiredoxin family protein [Sphingomonas sp. ID0503]|uniref:peroxiredoxin family protein n=1 Tax=Sphingomonas sp. ID0503 TaxID=3399691 RepID=UPI003AFA45AC
MKRSAALSPTLLSILATAVILIAAAAYLWWPEEEDGEVVPGAYRMLLQYPAGELPVGLKLDENGGKWTATFINGENRVAAEQVTVEGDLLIIAMPSYDSSIELSPQGVGFAGTAHLRRRSGRVDVPVHVEPYGGFRFFDVRDTPVKLEGEWPLTEEGEDAEPGLLIIKQDGDLLSGTVHYPSGDQRYLSGEVSGDYFSLSTFDGNQGQLWRGHKLADGTLKGEVVSATAKTPTKWTAKPGAANFAAVGEEKPPVDRIDFTFPDVDGKPVSLHDPRYKGKVVVVAIGGSWCPNCHDEAAFLEPYYKANAAQGLEVIGLSFEYTDDPVRSARQVKRFAQRFGLTYPTLVAGVATPEGTKKALPAIGGVKIYPTTLFIDRKGKLRAIHTGYAGPATGALNKKAMAEFDALVRELLAEKA